MKTRSGFVSNSSTSSFIIVGVRASKSQIEKLKDDSRDEDDGCYYEFKHDLRNPEYSSILGYEIASMSDDAPEEIEVELGEIEEKVSKLKEIFGESAKIKLFFGTEPC